MSAHRSPTAADGHTRVPRWRGDPFTAYLVPAKGHSSLAAIDRAVAAAVADGCRHAVTAALSREEQEPFLIAGFTVQERLHLLERSVDDLPKVQSTVVLRRGRRGDRPSILEVDRAAFSSFWHFDRSGLEDALDATPSSRLRVATDSDDSVTAYAVTGRAASRGYLQRLAVAPAAQRRGIGAALVVDSLRWLKRWGAREVLVNTQEANTSALALYEALGFRRRSNGLAVLQRDLTVAAS